MSELTVFLADCTLKSAVVLCAAWLAAFLLRSRSAALRHAVWTASLLAVVLMPAFAVYVTGWRSDFNLSTSTRFSPPLQRIETPTTEGSSVATSDMPSLSNSEWSSAIGWIWVFGALGIVAVLIREAARLARITYTAEPFRDSRWLRLAAELQRRLHMDRSIRFVQNAGASMLVTWGALNPHILLPSGVDDWTDLRMHAVLGHELAHIRRNDWFVQLIGEIARAIYWFNPLVWFACDRLRQEGERACDDAVLRLGVESTEYAAELLNIARILKTSTCSWAPSLAMAHASTLERRFAAMLNPSVDRQSISGKTALLIGILTLCVALPVAAMRAPFQRQTGRLFGRLYDPSGAPIQNATISVFDPNTSVQDTAISNALGVFEFPALPAGHYQLQTSAAGFEPFQFSSVTVEPNQDANLNILTVAAAATPSGMSTAPQAATPQPKLIRRVGPVYPATAPAQQIRDVVVLDAVIGTDGVPKAVRVMSNRGGADVSKAAVEAVRQWRYQPAAVNGVPVEAPVRVVVGVNSGSDSAVARTGLSTSAFALPAPPPPPPPPPPDLSSPIAPPAPPAPPAVFSESAKEPERTERTARIRQGGNIQQSMLVTQVKPIYPPDAKEARVQGIVLLEAVVGKEGDVTEVRVLSGHPMLQQAAIDAVSQWKYRPTFLNGEPVEVVTTITVNFAFQQ